MTDTKLKALGQLVALVVIAVAAGVAGIILGLSANGVEDLDAAVGLTTWSNYLLVVAAVAVIGAIVLSGVRSLLARVSSDS